MFKNDTENFFKIWDINWQSWIFQGSEQDLIMEIAKHWKEAFWDLAEDEKFFNSFLELCACSPKDPGDKRYQIFDKYNRIIQPLDYKEKSFEYWRKNQGKSLYFWRSKNYNKYTWYRNHYKKYIYRYDPVPNTRCFRGGPAQRMQKTKHIFLYYDDPIYKKEFTRGTKKCVPSWWDDKFKNRDIKNWKHQNKCRHQWQRGEKNKWLGHSKKIPSIQMDVTDK